MVIISQNRDNLLFTESGVCIYIDDYNYLKCRSGSGFISDLGQFDTKEEALRELKSIYTVCGNCGSYVTIDLLRGLE